MLESDEDEVDSERPLGQLPRLLDEPGDLVERAVGASEHAEATGIRHGTGESGAGPESEANGEGRIVDAELAAQRRPERECHEPIIARPRSIGLRATGPD